MELKKYIKRIERVLAFQFTDLEQAEVKEAVELGLAEIVSCYLGEEYEDDYLFIKTAIDKSRWTNVHEKECLVIDYIQIDNKIKGIKAKKISEDAFFNKYREEEPTLFEKIIESVDGKIVKDDNGEEIVEVNIDNLNKKQNKAKKKA